MEVLVKVPEHLHKYVEYIPEQELPVMFTNALEQYIQHQLSDDSKSHELDVSEVLSLLKSQIQLAPVSISDVATVGQSTGVQPAPVEQQSYNEIKFTEEDFDGLELDADDLMDLMR